MLLPGAEMRSRQATFRLISQYKTVRIAAVHNAPNIKRGVLAEEPFVE